MKMELFFLLTSLWWAGLLWASPLQVGKTGDSPCLIPFAKLQDSPWRIQRRDQRYPLVFLSYGQWPPEDRFAYECKKQSLLTPTWDEAGVCASDPIAGHGVGMESGVAVSRMQNEKGVL